jgi:hypothetical protein
MVEKKQDIWDTGESDEAQGRADAAFTNRVLSRVRHRTTIYDYTYMFVQGFFDIVVGLLKGMSKK